MNTKMEQMIERCESGLADNIHKHFSDMPAWVIDKEELARRFDEPGPYDEDLIGHVWFPVDHTPLDELFKDADLENNIMVTKRLGIPYADIERQTSVIRCKEKSKYSIIVPIRKRMEHCKVFLKYAEFYMRNLPGWTVTVVIQEDSDTDAVDMVSQMVTPDFFLNKLNIVSMPHELLESMYGDNMNRSLCYNVAHRLIECEWMINHDIDLLFNDEFFRHIESRTTDENCKWLQPFRGSRVIYLDPEFSERISNMVDGEQIMALSCEQGPPMNPTPNGAGAPGGSVVVPWKTFKQMGGYDPELIWGYAPEDALFWWKLECFHNEDFISRPDCLNRSHPFVSTEPLSHTSTVELFHLFHERTPSDKRYPYCSLLIVNWFLNNLHQLTLQEWLDVSYANLNS